jgi:iron complex outermembrane receptor protein
MKKLFLITLGALLYLGSGAQTVRGIVTDAENQKLSFANISLVGTNLSTISNKDGAFSFIDLNKGSYQLLISHVGKQNYEQKFTVNNTDIDLGTIVLPEANFVTEELVVTATKTKRALKTIPASVALITSKDIDLIPNQKVDENLRYISGIYVDRPFGIFGKSVVTMRGVVSSEPGRQLTLIDGVPINKSDGGGVNWNRIITSNIDKIELVKGPGSSIYGSNAMGGTINLISKRPLKKGLNANAKAYYGTYNTMGADFNYMQKFGDKTEGFYYTLSGKYLKSDGYQTVPDSIRQDSDTLVFVNEQAANASIGYRFNNNSIVEIEYNYYDDHRGQGSKIKLDDGSTADFDTHFLKLKHQNKIGQFNIDLNAFAQLEQYLRTVEKQKNDDYTLYYVKSDRLDYGLLSSINTQIKAHNISLGIDYRNGSVYGMDEYQTSTDKVINQGKIRHFNIFAQDQIDFKDQLKAIAAIQYSFVDFYDGAFTLENPTSSSDFMLSDAGELSDKQWHGWSPSLSFIYDFNKSSNVYILGSSGYRAASLDDFTRTGFINIGYKLANPDIKPETIYNGEIGYRYDNNNIYASANIYFSQGKDFMHYIATGDYIFGGRKAVYKKQNIANVQIYGLELNCEYKVLKWLRIAANYTYNNSEIIKFPGREDLEGKLLSYTPQQIFNLRTLTRWKHLNASVNLRYQEKMFLDEDNTFEIDPLLGFDIRLSYEIYKGLGAGVNIQNLFNEQHMVSIDQVSLGRFISFEISYKLN